MALEVKIKTLKASLTAKKGHCTREFHRVQKELNETTINFKNLQNAIDKLNTKHNSYQQTFEDYETVLIEAESSTLLKQEQDSFKQYDSGVNELLIKANIVANDEEKRDITTKAELTSKSHVKLPPVSLIKFDGDLAEWPTFWANFKSLVHDNSDLAKSTKFAHLRDCLKAEAFEVIRYYPCDDASYDVAIKKLQDAYSNEEALKEHLVYKLLDLSSPKYTVSDMNTFVHTYESLISSLKNLQSNLDDSEWLINKVIARKIPKEVRTYLELKHQKIYFQLNEITLGLYECIKKLRANCEDENPTSISHEDMKLYKVRDSNSSSQISKFQKPKLNIKSNLPSKSKVTETKHRSEATINATVQTLQHSQRDKIYSCVFCGEHHYSSICTEYTSIKARQSRLMLLERCTRCLKKGHKSNVCDTQLWDCRKCKTPHHNAMCPKRLNSKPEVTESQTVSSSSSISSIGTCSVALATATATLYSGETSKPVRVFFDQGAQCTIIRKDLVNKIGLNPVRHQNIAVSGLLQDADTKQYQIVQFSLRIGNRKRTIYAIVMDRAVAPFKVPGLVATYNALKRKGVRLADRSIHQDVVDNVDITIGGCYYSEYVMGIVKIHGVDLCKTPGGYMIYGRLNQTDITSVVSNEVTANFMIPETMEDPPPVEKLWNLDVIGIDPSKNKPEDDITYEQFLSDISYDGQQYWVRLPWKPDHRPLPTNYSMAYGQLKKLRSSLENQGKLSIYDELIQSQLKADFIESVPNARPIQGENHYLPHHAVIKDSITTPLRMVFNCSAKTGRSPSLNECLMTGPSLTTKLGDVLLKFRTGNYGYTADISKAFLRVGLKSCDRDYTRFLWCQNPQDPNSDLITYRFKSVLFGATSSPFLLQATLETHLKLSSSPFKDRLKKEFYVDNLQGTTNDSENLLKIYEEANKVMSEANMPLCSWRTNDESLQERIQNDFPEQPCLTNCNILGINWNIEDDTLNIKSRNFECHSHLSKRKLLSDVSSIFDPLGLLTPLTIRGKLLIKQAWILKVGWDDILPDSFNHDWNDIRENLLRVDSITLPRSVINETSCNLHVFCDASSYAYGAVAYITTGLHSNLLTSKSRVTPVNTRSLPQLELTALQVGTQLAFYIVTTLDITIEKVFIWSDNEAALQWIRNNRSENPYVKNRVAKIKELSNHFKFLHVGSKENPADLLTRGSDINSLLKTSLWSKGPHWLTTSEWPIQKLVVTISMAAVIPCEYIFDCTVYSSLNKIIKVTEIVFRFITERCKSIINFQNGLHYWLYAIQQIEYESEIKTILGTSDGKKSSLVRSLGLYIDPTDRLIHCRGRIENTNAIISKFPILLPRKHHITKCLIMKLHSQVMHGGTADTLACLRETYWLPKGRQIIKQAISRCFICKYLLAKPYSYPGPPVLPECRIALGTPFSTVGVDYSGYILIKNHDVTMKYYFCLFTCATTRAIHLELAQDMTASTFLQLLRRFIANWTCPQLLISDHGKYFTSTAEFLKSLQDDPEVKKFLNEREIQWHFIPPRSPWMGGFYERLVGIVKRALKLSLFRKHISADELRTLLAEITQRVNNRPITYIDDDIGNPIPLTPSHLLYGRRMEPFPTRVFHEKTDPTYGETNVLKERFSYQSKILSCWEKVWAKEYVASLREKFYGNKCNQQKCPPKVGDIVIVASDENRADWPLGKITKLFPDNEGIIRVVQIFSRGNTYIKTLNKLVPLETSSIQDDQTNILNVPEPTSDHADTLPHEEKKRPPRKAAQIASEKRQQLIANDQL